MKKFLIILMVLAMASVLFVGCTTPPTPTPTPTPDPATVSATPALASVYNAVTGVAIFDVTSTADLYMNIAQVGNMIGLQGTAPAESLVKIYIDDVAIATVAETAVTGLWTLFVAKSSLGADGVKVLTAKCTEVGLAESVASNSVTFTLDTVRPSALTLTATADTAADQDVASAITSGQATIASAVVADVDNLVAGTYTITIKADSNTSDNIEIAAGTGTMTTQTFTLAEGANATFTEIIPGITFNLTSAITLIADIGSVTTLTVTNTDAIEDRASILFSEDVTTASAIAAANYTWANSTTGVAPVDVPGSYVNLTEYFTFGVGALARFDIISCVVDDLVDLAGNVQTTANSVSCTVGAASATALVP